MRHFTHNSNWDSFSGTERYWGLDYSCVSSGCKWKAI